MYIDSNILNFKYFQAKETGQLPSLKELYERTHKTKAGVFVDPRSEQIYNDVVARIEDRQTQLTQQSPDGIPVVLSTQEVDQIYEEVKILPFNLLLIYFFKLLTLNFIFSL